MPERHPAGYAGHDTDAEAPVDYSTVDVPDVAPAEYSYNERRAAILRRIREAGHPNALDKNALADEFGVKRDQIVKDFDRINDHVEATLGDDRAVVGAAVFDRSIRELLDEGEWRKAALTMQEYHEFAEEFKDLKQMEARINRIERHREGDG